MLGKYGHDGCKLLNGVSMLPSAFRNSGNATTVTADEMGEELLKGVFGAS